MAATKFSSESLALGLALLRDARKRFPDVDDAQALCAHAEAGTGILTGSTVRNYRHRYFAALEWITQNTELPPDIADGLRRRIAAALERRRGKPLEPRTASKKVRDAQAWMVRAVFGHLQISAVRYKRTALAATALYCVVQPRLGARPVELHRAVIDGDVLTIPNAKRADDTLRGLDLSSWHPTHRMAVAILIQLARDDVDTLGYAAWLSRLAENLARACKAASRVDAAIPRLAPTSFRHTAISTWHAAGYTVEEIAEMAGHLLVSSAARHYVRKSATWAMREGDMVRPVEPIAKPPKAEDQFGLEDFPAPSPSPAKTKAAIDWRGYVEAAMQLPTASDAEEIQIPNTDNAKPRSP